MILFITCVYDTSRCYLPNKSLGMQLIPISPTSFALHWILQPCPCTGEWDLIFCVSFWKMLGFFFRQIYSSEFLVKKFRRREDTLGLASFLCFLIKRWLKPRDYTRMLQDKKFPIQSRTETSWWSMPLQGQRWKHQDHGLQVAKSKSTF